MDRFPPDAINRIVRVRNHFTPRAGLKEAKDACEACDWVQRAIAWLNAMDPK